MARMKPDLSQKNRRIFTLLSDYATSDCRQLLRPTVWIRRSSCLRRPPSPQIRDLVQFFGETPPGGRKPRVAYKQEGAAASAKISWITKLGGPKGRLDPPNILD
jgi:hypothetical protein